MRSLIQARLIPNNSMQRIGRSRGWAERSLRNRHHAKIPASRCCDHRASRRWAWSLTGQSPSERFSTERFSAERVFARRARRDPGSIRRRGRRLAHGTGSQIYTCQAGQDDKFSWTLKAPDAELHDRNDKLIGQHSAGPTWKLKDGSEVTGKAVAKVNALDPYSIPWLLVKVMSNAGKGALQSVTTIQRVHTHGGQPPTEGCD